MSIISRLLDHRRRNRDSSVLSSRLLASKRGQTRIQRHGIPGGEITGIAAGRALRRQKKLK